MTDDPDWMLGMFAALDHLRPGAEAEFARRGWEIAVKPDGTRIYTAPATEATAPFFTR